MTFYLHNNILWALYNVFISHKFQLTKANAKLAQINRCLFLLAMCKRHSNAIVCGKHIDEKKCPLNKHTILIYPKYEPKKQRKLLVWWIWCLWLWAFLTEQYKPDGGMKTGRSKHGHLHIGKSQSSKQICFGFFLKMVFDRYMLLHNSCSGKNDLLYDHLTNLPISLPIVFQSTYFFYFN